MWSYDSGLKCRREPRRRSRQKRQDALLAAEAVRKVLIGFAPVGF